MPLGGVVTCCCLYIISHLSSAYYLSSGFHMHATLPFSQLLGTLLKCLASVASIKHWPWLLGVEAPAVSTNFPGLCQKPVWMCILCSRALQVLRVQLPIRWWFRRPRTCGQPSSDPQGFNMCNIYVLTACSTELYPLVNVDIQGGQRKFTDKVQEESFV